MTDVKRIFFIDKKECEDLRKNLHDPYIVETLPHYELNDGRIMYGKMGAPATFESFWREAGDNR